VCARVCVMLVWLLFASSVSMHTHAHNANAHAHAHTRTRTHTHTHTRTHTHAHTCVSLRMRQMLVWLLFNSTMLLFFGVLHQAHILKSALYSAFI
jgi:hypothetical protein